MAVDLAALAGTIQDPPVAHHGAADALRALPTELPVVKHLVVGRPVEDGERGVQCCRGGGVCRFRVGQASRIILPERSSVI